MTCAHDFNASENEGHILRSQMVDQFVGIEQWAADIATQLGKAAPNVSFGQRIKLIRKSKESFRHPTRIDKLCDQMEYLVKLRNDLVHAQLDCLLRKSGECVWIFRNIAKASSLAQASPLILEKREFDQQNSDIKKLAKELRDQKLKPIALQKD